MTAPTAPPKTSMARDPTATPDARPQSQETPPTHNDTSTGVTTAEAKLQHHTSLVSDVADAIETSMRISGKNLRVAYQGEPGAYSHQASCQFFPDTTPEFLPYDSFAKVVHAVNEGHADRAALPIENCQAGTIHSNLDLLLRHPLVTIVGEMDFAVRHALLANPGVKMEDVKIVRSHYMALDQCDGFIRDHGLKGEVAYDTAGSAKLLQEQGQTDVAAIASVVAAKAYNLNILQEDIQNDFQNYTRFLILALNTEPYKPGVPSKTSLAFSLDNSPGVLWRAISVFGALNIDMTKIESRHIYTVRKALGPPVDSDINEKRWGYVFYVDFNRHVDEESVAAGLVVLKQMTTFYRVLGSYPAHEIDHILVENIESMNDS